MAMGVQILDALQYLHRFGYAHADIKSDNLCLGNALLQRKDVVRFFQLFCSPKSP